MTELNRHHLLYEKDDWMRRRYLRDIRTTRGMILRLPMIEVHRALHIHQPTGVPIPSREAAIEFTNSVVLPYEPGQNLFRTVDQAISWFAMTDNQPTAEHLWEQKQFIIGRLAVEEAA